jgi:hypothetical protein
MEDIQVFTRWHIPVFIPVCWGAGIQDRIPVPAGIRRNPAATSLMFRLFYGPEHYFRSGPDVHVLPTLYVGMYAFRPNPERVPVFQSAGNLVPIGISAESGRNVPPSGFSGSHWILPLGECLHRIALVAGTVMKIGGKHKNTNKTPILASNYGKNQSLVVCQNFIPKNGPSTQLIDATSCEKNVRCHD